MSEKKAERLILFPFGGNAREAISSIDAMNRQEARWEIIGFIDDDTDTHDRGCCGIPVIGGRDRLADYPDAKILAVPGSSKNYLKRGGIICGLGRKTDSFATIIHPSADISQDAVIGNNTLIMTNVVIGSSVRIEGDCIILPNTVISHDSVIGRFSCVGSNCSISGSVKIGMSCYIASGTSIIDGITIGEGAMIGLGSNVLTDIAGYTVVAGNPARQIV